jgi:hypothetical protein
MVNNDTSIVDNMIVADPFTDPAPPGYTLIAVPDDSPVSIGWEYNFATGTFFPPPEPPAEAA